MIPALRSRLRLFGALCLAAATAGAAATAQAATGEVVDLSKLRVCADPGNLPYSDDQGGGFENKIAKLLAEDLGVQLEYTWY